MFQNSLFNQSSMFGGNQRAAQVRSEEHQRYLQLREIAKEEGVLDKLREIEAPDWMKTGFGKLVDFAQREAYAAAGVVDVMVGEGRDGENVAERWAREMLGDTRIGDYLGIQDPDREWAKEVLADAGMKKGGELSDLFGDPDWAVFKYFNPNMRSLAGLGIELAMSPTSYVTMGSGGATKFAGKAGKINATRTAEKLAFQKYRKNILRYAHVNGEDMTPFLKEGSKYVFKEEFTGDKLTDKAAKMFADVEARVLSTRAAKEYGDALLEYGAEKVRQNMIQEAQGFVADATLRMQRRANQLKKMGKRGDLTKQQEKAYKEARQFVSQMSEKSGVRVGVPPFLDSHVRGQLILDFAPLGPGAEMLKDLARGTPVVGWFVKEAESIKRTLDETFARVPKWVRDTSPALEQALNNRHVMKSASLDMADQHIHRILGSEGNAKKLGKVFDNDTEYTKLLMKALDEPLEEVEQVLPNGEKEIVRQIKEGGYRDQVMKRAEELGVADEVQHFVEMWELTAASLGQSAVKMELLTPAQYKTWEGRYIPHLPKSDNPEVTRVMSEFLGPSLGGFSQARKNATFDELEESMRLRGLDPDEYINYNPVQVMTKYIQKHIEAVADQDFMLEIQSNIAPKPHNVLRQLSMKVGVNLDQLGVDMDQKTLERVRDILDRSPITLGDQRAKQHTRRILGTQTRYEDDPDRYLRPHGPSIEPGNTLKHTKSLEDKQYRGSRTVPRHDKLLKRLEELENQFEGAPPLKVVLKELGKIDRSNLTDLDRHYLGVLDEIADKVDDHVEFYFDRPGAVFPGGVYWVGRGHYYNAAVNEKIAKASVLDPRLSREYIYVKGPELDGETWLSNLTHEALHAVTAKQIRVLHNKTKWAFKASDQKRLLREFPQEVQEAHENIETAIEYIQKNLLDKGVR